MTRPTLRALRSMGRAQDGSERAGSPLAARLLSGYGPLLALVLVLLVVTVYVPTIPPEQLSASGSLGGGAVRSPLLGDDAGTAEGAGGSGSSAAAGSGSARAGGSGGGSAAGPAAAAGVRACPDRPLQIPGDPYSPPCFSFSGSNGGETSRGVTGDTIKVSFRLLDDFGLADALLRLGSRRQVSDTPADVRRTAEALVEYLNQRFQLYGRKVEVTFYEGRGNITNETLGGGQEEAEADAIKVAEEIGAFADATGSSFPYVEALAAKQVLNVGVPYMPRRRMRELRPYVWSEWPDGTIIAELSMEQAFKRLLGKPAKYAGGDLRDRPRTYAIVGPENPWYQETISHGEEVLKEYGYRGYDQNLTYRFELGTYSNDAANIIAKLKAAQITTIVCACDPVFVTFLTAKATEQQYFPEWHQPATAFLDLDVMAQQFDPEQWKRAFGITLLGPPQPVEAGMGYRAYKSVRSDEPSLSVEFVYYQLYVLFLGIHMAGPNLAPETFEQGMTAYPGGDGPAGSWKFPEGFYTPIWDAREIWWNPDAVSRSNGEKGAYADCFGGTRYGRHQWPEGEVGPCS